MRVLGGLEGHRMLDSPSWVVALLRQPWVMLTVRIGLVSAYFIGGVAKLLHFDAAAAEQVHFGLHPGWLWASIAIFVELVGSLCIIFARFTWLAAGALAALTLVAMFVANDFWRLEGAAHFIALNSFFEHLGLIAAFVMVTRLVDVGRRSSE
ncbi:DoxX family protein [Caballeronia sp. INDeC2]|uniref:DoxX family protein n=1 Tax=Caballeronia sp. INDeC2 TaxID=2921747 RepID=UPI00202922DB|nr:DoxX family protein [Caballeronia sp. INDeC2]